jgi:hypothetical protein
MRTKIQLSYRYGLRESAVRDVLSVSRGETKRASGNSICSRTVFNMCFVGEMICIIWMSIQQQLCYLFLAPAGTTSIVAVHAFPLEPRWSAVRHTTWNVVHRYGFTNIQSSNTNTNTNTDYPDEATIDMNGDIYHDDKSRSLYSNNRRLESAVLNQKLQGLHLSDQKLLVLQDAAKRMVRRHEANLLETQSSHVLDMATFQEDHQIQYQSQIGNLNQEWESRLQRVELERTNARNGLMTAQEEYVHTLNRQSDEHARQLESMKLEQEQERAVWSGVEDRLRSQLTNMEQETRKNRIRTNATIQALQLELQEERENHRLWREECERITEKYQRAKVRMDHLRDKNEELLLLNAVGNENEMVQQQPIQYQEQIDIATSAAAAAIQREQSVQEKYDALLQQYNQSQRHNTTDMPRERNSKKSVPIPSTIRYEAEVTAAQPTWIKVVKQRFGSIQNLIWKHDAVRAMSRWLTYAFLPRVPFRLVRKKMVKRKTRDD